MKQHKNKGKENSDSLKKLEEQIRTAKNPSEQKELARKYALQSKSEANQTAPSKSLRTTIFLVMIIGAILFFWLGTSFSGPFAGKAFDSATCELLSAEWIGTEAIVGQPVEILVATNDFCDGAIINFEIREYDAPGVVEGLGDPVQQNPQPALVEGSAAQTTWIAEFQDDYELIDFVEFNLIPPEYYIIASVEGYPDIMVRSPQNYDDTLPVYEDTLDPIHLDIIHVTDHSATLVFSTSALATAEVEYGVSDFSKNETRDQGRYHRISLTDLSPGTTYQYRINIVSDDERTYQSPTETFTTFPHNDSVIIVDNLDPGFDSSGNWPVSSFDSDSFGENSLVSQVNTGDEAEWSFTIPVEGTWEVSLWWSSQNWEKRTEQSVYTIETGSGNVDVTVNQQKQYGQWNTIGEFNFTEGTHRIRLEDKTADTDPQKTVSADAVKLVFVRELVVIPDPQENTCDNQSGSVCNPLTHTCENNDYVEASDTTLCCVSTCSLRDVPENQFGLYVVTSSVDVRVNVTVPIGIAVYNVTNLSWFTVYLHYNSSLLAFDDVYEYSDFFGGKSNPGVHCIRPYQSASGVVGPLHCWKDEGTVNGSGMLLTVFLRTLDEGISTLEITNVTLLDEEGQDIVMPHHTANLTIAEPGCIDHDLDGYLPFNQECLLGSDCDDYNPDIRPGAFEVCNGIDDNCDGIIDNNGVAELCELQLGVCQGKVKSCLDGAFDSCGPAQYGPDYNTTEMCDGLDNDCDGYVDENLTAPLCSRQFGVCENTTQICAGTSGWQDCTYSDYGINFQPTELTCNDNLDNDCDNITDEVPLSDPTNCGSCGHVCNLTHAFSVCYGTSCMISSCRTNYFNYDNDHSNGCEYYCVPDNSTGANATELCDGIDNNCDGEVDEDCPCQLGEERECGLTTTGTCSLGTQSCVNGTWGTCEDAVGPVAELCDGLDNDCDGKKDNGLSGEYCRLQEGVCRGARKTCSGSTGWKPCTVSNYGPDYVVIEASDNCDGMDNDCDGEVDEGCHREPEPPIVDETPDPLDDPEPPTDSYDDYDPYADDDYDDGVVTASSSGVEWWLWLLLLLLLLGLAAGGYFVFVALRKKHPHNQGDDLNGMASKPSIGDLERLKKYCYDVLKLGFVEGEIKNALTAVGWRPGIQDEAYNAAYKLFMDSGGLPRKTGSSGPTIPESDTQRRNELMKRIEKSYVVPDTKKKSNEISSAFDEVGTLDEPDDVLDNLRDISNKEESG